MIFDRLLHRMTSLWKQEGPVSLARSTVRFLRAHIRIIGRAIYLRPLAVADYWKYKYNYRKAAPKPYETITINPNDIERLLVPHFWSQNSHYSTHIKPGNWDLEVSDDEIMISGVAEGIAERKLISFDNFLLYNSAKERYNNEKPWEDTKLYHWLMTNMDLLWWDYNSPKQVERSLLKLDQLYNSMQTEGYLTQKELSGRNSLFGYFRSSPAIHEVAVNIGRDGQLIFDDGRHRLVIAKVLQLDKIPVRVFVRHKDWQELRTEVRTATSIDDLSKKAKENLDHPDIQPLVPDHLQ